MATTTTSKQFWLNARDLIRALIYAMISPVIPIVLQSMKAQAWVFDWTAIWHTAVGAGVTYLATKFFTPTQTITTPARILILCICLAAAAPGQAQILKPLEKPAGAVEPRRISYARSLFIADSTLPQPIHDSVFRGLRWTGLQVLYGYRLTNNPQGSGKAFAGTGINYEQATYSSATKRWSTEWGIGGGLYWGQALDNKGSSSPAAAAYVTLLNKHLIIGVVYSFVDRNVLAAGGPNGFLVPTN